MSRFNRIGQSSKSTQYFITIGSVLFLVLICHFSVDILGYRVVALLLLLLVSALAMIFDILPVLIAAIVSAMVWNFFFIPPELTFRIGNAEDLLLFLMYFVVAVVNAVLTFRIRKAEKHARLEEERERTITLYNTLLNTLSHELRTPISTIIGATDTLTDESNRLSDVNKAQLLNEIETAATRLNRLVENLLSMSRLESGFLELKHDWCDVNELIHNMIHAHHQELQNHQVIFNARDDLPLYKLDQALIEQVLINLLLNAVRYTPANSPIELTAFPQNGACVITVSDRGKGFPTGELNAVFEKFYRSSNAIPGGTGLGLSIAKGFTQAHGGTITLQNKPAGGALFTITIPAEYSDIQPLDND